MNKNFSTSFSEGMSLICQSMLQELNNIIQDPNQIFIQFPHLYTDLYNINDKLCTSLINIDNFDPKDITARLQKYVFDSYDIIAKYQINYIENIPESSENTGLFKFILKQFVSSFSPQNFPFFNLEVLNNIHCHRFDRFILGYTYFLSDILKSKPGLLNISTSDKSYFTLGKNLASTEGKIVYQNHLMELIYYKPLDACYDVPLLIIPAWINKYYILDLSQHNSFVRWLVENNLQVFIISWKNPDKSMRNISFEDYLIDGVVQSYKIIKEMLVVKDINALGYCLGGTLLAASISYMKKANIGRFNSATLLTTLLDFKNAGILKYFVTNIMLDFIEEKMEEEGILDGRYLSFTFNLIKSNSMLWPYWVNNYLLGNKPEASDMLYWNSDSTNLPQSMHSFYLRNMYLQNLLIKPNAISLKGKNIDLGDINIPIFSLATVKDHIAPWKAVYDGIFYLKNSDVTFCLSGSGHINGVINPPVNNNYGFWINNSHFCRSAEDWKKGALEHTGSWWKRYLPWIKGHSGNIGTSKYKKTVKNIQYKAPGKYVKISYLD